MLLPLCLGLCSSLAYITHPRELAAFWHESANRRSMKTGKFQPQFAVTRRPAHNTVGLPVEYNGGALTFQRHQISEFSFWQERGKGPLNLKLP